MKYRLMDLLACPICKNFPLELHIFSRKEVSRTLSSEDTKPLCEIYCAYKSSYIKDLKETPPCEECIRYEIIDGLLFCKSGNRWYPIIEAIPHMLPDDLRDKEEDLNFLKKWKNNIPEKILKNGKPFNLEE
ncbi:MAG: Trm112 family protein [Candidatus Methanomethylicaceae archaeon]